jgi:hypothetical protein
MRSFSIALGLLFLALVTAHAQLSQTGAGQVAGGGIPSNGKILLADGTSFLLQTDAVSKVCRAAGC